jgi:nucleoid DNA-binding protein
MLVIWKAFGDYLQEKMDACKGVYVKNFGSFTYEVTTEKPKMGIDYTQANSKTFSELLLEKKSTHKLSPCFVIDQRFRRALPKYLYKDVLDKPKSQASVFQKGFQMIYLNFVPIAAACFFSQKLVSDTLNTIFNAIFDIVNYGKNLSLKLGFCNIYFTDGNMRYAFNPNLGQTISNLVETEAKLKKGVTPMSENWKIPSLFKWGKSSLSSLIKRPDSSLVQTVDKKTKMLQLMSVDMASTYRNNREENY